MRVSSYFITASVLLTIAACGSPQLPSFIDSGKITRADLTCLGKTATTDQSKDNLNELLNLLHLGDLTPGARTTGAPPDSPVCTVHLFEQEVPSFQVLIPAGAQTQEVYLRNETGPTNTGTYPLPMPIRAAELQGFVTKYTHGRK